MFTQINFFGEFAVRNAKEYRKAALSRIQSQEEEEVGIFEADFFHFFSRWTEVLEILQNN